MTYTLEGLAERIHGANRDKGFWESERSDGETIALIHSELSEALEEARSNNPLLYFREDGKPEGLVVEILDAVIREFDYLGKLDVHAETGYTLDEIFEAKLDYNATRPHKHGRAF